MTMISYAQIGEDVLLRRVFPPHYCGFYIDVGANHPVNCSVTKHFYDSGWSGINIEPGTIYNEIPPLRPRDLNLQVAISNEESTLTFYEFPNATALSTLSKEVAERRSGLGQPYFERQVPVLTLRTLCERYVGARLIDFMSIDVEGRELQVIEGADWTRFRPRILLVEANGVESWEPILLSHRYHRANFDGINVWYVRDEDRQWLDPLRVPVTAGDDYIAAPHVRGMVDYLQHLVETGHTAEIAPTSLRIGLRVAGGLQSMARRFPRLAHSAVSIARRAA
ncbi:MAG: FkbM family methyltransferase [Pirellulales bacterium]|nr:FkbM family methyltransferase [Pirellulales bacterium]